MFGLGKCRFATKDNESFIKKIHNDKDTYNLCLDVKLFDVQKKFRHVLSLVDLYK